MAWVQALPLLVRSIPAFAFGLLCISVLVFLARHPVDGDQRVIDAGLEHARLGVLVFGLTLFCMAPSWLMLGALLALALAVIRFGGVLLGLITDQIERNSFV